MGHKLRKRRHNAKKRILPKEVTDVSLSDFADASLPLRVKKSRKRTRNLTLEVERISISDKSWEDRADEDFDLICGKQSDTSVVNEVPSNIKSDGKQETKRDCGKDYPLDLWFLLSSYIRPEQISVFSLLCKASHYVVNTPKFWISLYKRFYRRNSIPSRLQPHCLEVHHGLKPNVIQALHYTYGPFSARAQSSMYLTEFEVLNCLIGMRCLIMYIEKVYENESNKWLYKFKFKKNICDENSTQKIHHRIHVQDDINSNPEGGCRMLFVPCRDYICVPCVNGYKLKRVSGSWKEMRLVFSLGPLSLSSTEDVTIILTPCLKPSIFDWWHPMYSNEKSNIGNMTKV